MNQDSLATGVNQDSTDQPRATRPAEADWREVQAYLRGQKPVNDGRDDLHYSCPD